MSECEYWLWYRHAWCRFTPNTLNQLSGRLTCKKVQGKSTCPDATKVATRSAPRVLSKDGGSIGRVGVGRAPGAAAKFAKEGAMVRVATSKHPEPRAKTWSGKGYSTPRIRASRVGPRGRAALSCLYVDMAHRLPTMVIVWRPLATLQKWLAPLPIS